MQDSKAKSDKIISIKREIQNWYVLYVRSRQEKRANENLVESGYRTYLPLQKKLRTYRTSKKWIEDPVFKSYIFIKVKRHELYNILQNPYVVTYIKFQGEPAIIREEELLFIKRLLMNETTFEVIEGELEIGQEIEIKSGLFAGVKGHVKEIRGKKSLVIQIKSLNSNIIISMADIKLP